MSSDDKSKSDEKTKADEKAKSDGKTKTQQDVAFGKRSTQDKRDKLRVQLDGIQASLLSKNIPVGKSPEYVSAAANLFTHGFIKRHATKNGVSTSGKKAEMLALMLAKGWTIPSDKEALEDDADILGAQIVLLEEEEEEEDSAPAQVRYEDDTTKNLRLLADFVPMMASLKKLVEKLEEPVPMRSPAVLKESKDDKADLAFAMFARAVESSSAVTKKFVEEQDRLREDRIIESGGLTARAKSQLQKGEFVKLLDVFDLPVARQRYESLRGKQEKPMNKPTSVEAMDFVDFCQAMTKLGVLYEEHGQKNLSIQILNLLHAVFIASATYTRVSVMKATERVREESTSHDVRWSFESLVRGTSFMFLESLTAAFAARKGGPKKRKFGGFTSFRERELPVQQAATFNLKKQDVCRYWWAGQNCTYPACKFRHNCDACGKVAVHNPSRCKLEKGINGHNAREQQWRV